MINSIIKRDGRLAPFDINKIGKAIEKCFKSLNYPTNQVGDISRQVEEKLEASFVDKIPNVEQIQDLVQQTLMDNNLYEAASVYIIYRNERSKIREKSSSLMKTYKNIAFSKSVNSNIKRENANIDTDAPMGAMLKYGSEGAKEFNRMFILTPEFLSSHDLGLIHIHDLDFYTLTLTCCQLDLQQLFKGGFKTGHGYLREPQDIKTYSALTCIAIQANQNDQHGGQSIAKFDYDLEIGVIKTYQKRFVNNLRKSFELLDIQLDASEVLKKIKEESNVFPRLNDDSIVPYLKKYITTRNNDKIIEFVIKESKKETVKDTYQAMESLIHNLNTMHSRAGAQVPFSSLNYGTNTTHEGRLIIEQLLLATDAGLGNGETPIFPIQIFKVKDGINYNPSDPNYDLFKLAIKVSAKRLFPNFSFLDATFNAQYYKNGRPETEVAYMGCRTRVIANTFDPENEVVTGRGNSSFTSINLVRIAIQANKNIEMFFSKLGETISLVIKQLLHRFAIQQKLHVYNFPFLMGEGIWLGSKTLNWTDEIGEVIKQATLSVGFIGLAETLKSLIGYHHGENKSAQELGLKIIGFMRQKMDEASENYKLNFSLVATPAEGLSGRFVKLDREKFGSIEGVTDRDYYTNSFHVPVYYPITAFKKIEIEAKYHPLTNGGHISYVELDGDASKNLKAFESIIRFMHDKGIGYGSINHSVDYDAVCGYVGIINDECPKCHRHETPELGFDRIRRITGYLVGTLTRFNDAKLKEVQDRVKHGIK